MRTQIYADRRPQIHADRKPQMGADEKIALSEIICGYKLYRKEVIDSDRD